MVEFDQSGTAVSLEEKPLQPKINYALRQTLVLCLPVAVGLLIGQLHLGLLFSLVPACCNIAGL
ncbi:hypothetical protein MJM95_31655, partial [Salmonella enterica subsp. enterica serovar Anatum]|nr:hypothetical protein [Salmonella enterica subsp. enterica serovar Anatum]